MGLSKIIQDIKDALKPEPYDSSIFNHPIALKTKWNPKIPGGPAAKNRSLHKLSSSKLVYKSTIYVKIIVLILIFLPIILFFTIFDNLSNLRGFEYVFILIPLMLPLTGLFFLYKVLRPIVIDKKLGYLYKSYKKPKTGFTITPNKKWVALDQVIALQILKEKVTIKNSSYYSYEINFVLKDANRYNVADHGELSFIEQDAIILSNFLGVPIWNKITGKTTFPINDTHNKKESLVNYNSDILSYDSPENNNDLDKSYNSLKKRKL